MKLNMTWQEVWDKFKVMSPPFVAYRDASYGNCTYKCELKHCFRGVEYAAKAGILNLSTFNYKHYDFYEKVQHGDMNWILPNKLLAFSTPHATSNAVHGVR